MNGKWNKIKLYSGIQSGVVHLQKREGKEASRDNPPLLPLDWGQGFSSTPNPPTPPQKRKLIVILTWQVIVPPTFFCMAVPELQSNFGMQMVNFSQEEDQDMIKGVAWLLGLRHKLFTSEFNNSFLPSQMFNPLQVRDVAIENGLFDSSHGVHSCTIDLGVQDFNKKRKRATREEVCILRHAFAANPLPPLQVRMSISHQLNWTPRKVKIWFQNERAKIRKKTREVHDESIRTSESADENEYSHKESTFPIGSGKEAIFSSPDPSLAANFSTSTLKPIHSQFKYPSSCVSESHLSSSEDYSVNRIQIHCASPFIHSPNHLPLSHLQQPGIPQS